MIILYYVYVEEKEEWMGTNRRLNYVTPGPKFVRLAQVLHQTADREDPKLVMAVTTQHGRTPNSNPLDKYIYKLT